MSDERELSIRVTLRRPPAGVRFAVQSGKAGAAGRASLTEVHQADGSGDLTFRFTLRVTVAPAEPPRFRGPLIQGTPAARFVYLTVGVRAGQAESPWDRRVKIPLASITAPLVEQALARKGRWLEAELEGTLADGSPICATQPFVGGGWRVASGT